MIRAFRNLIERQIQTASAQGELSGLEGEGKPLPDRTGQELVDPGLSAGIRIMAEAGAVPEEFKIKKELDQARADYASLSDEAERRAAAKVRAKQEPGKAQPPWKRESES